MNSRNIIYSICGGAVLLPAILNAQVIYSDLGMASSAGYSVNAAALISGSYDSVANFGVSYTSTLGVPQDPFSSSTTALQLKINETTGNQAGISVSPISLVIPSGDFTMTFDAWWNYNSGGFTAGSTQVGSFGLTTAASQLQAAGVGSGQLFGNITDNGSSTSYRGYNTGASIGSVPFVGSSQSYASSYHVSLFPSVDVPAGETALDANQYGSTVAGTLGFQWIQVEISYKGGVLSESLDGNLIASYSTATVGPDIFLGMYDINNGSAGVTGLADQNYMLYDNLVVSVPEPMTWSLIILGGVGLFVARRRSLKA